MERFEAIIEGEVQGVWFRDYTRHNAGRLNIVGLVRNLRDGTVQVIAQGKSEDLEIFLDLLREGPPLARVSDVTLTWHGPSHEHTTFVIAETQ